MMGQLWTVASLEVRQMIGGTKLLAITLMLGALAVLALAVRVIAVPPPQVPPETFWPAVFLLMLNFVFLQTTVILVPLLFASSLIRNEVDEGTLVYLVTRPIPRPLLLLAKFSAVSVVSAGLVVGGMGIFLLAFLLPGGDPTGGAFSWWGRIFDFMAAGVLGVIGYGALFTLVGLVFKRGLIWGIAYGFVSEFVLTNFPAVIREMTLMYYLRAVALANIDLESLGFRVGKGDLEDMKRIFGFLDQPSSGSAWLTVLVVAGIALALAALVIRKREFSATPTQGD